MRTSHLALWACVFFGTLVAQRSVERVQDIKTIYVGSFGEGPGSDLIRNKVIARLVKSGRVEVVENPESADAILTGVGELSKSTYYSANATTTNASAAGGTRYHATSAARVLNRQQKILWADEASNGMFYRSATSSVADKLVKTLKAMKPIKD